MPIAIVTGASRGLGLALSRELVGRGWSIVIDATGPAGLRAAERALRQAVAPGASLVALAGDVAEARHRAHLCAAAAGLGGLDLLVNNASVLGPSPLGPLARFPLSELARVYEVNVLAPLALIQQAAGLLRQAADPVIVNVTSDAAVEHYEGWGGYGSSKAALDHLSGTVAAEEPRFRVLAVDPGDMRTEMHQAAFPGEDISDRPLPETVAPAIVGLIESGATSGRYRVADVPAESGLPA